MLAQAIAPLRIDLEGHFAGAEAHLLRVRVERAIEDGATLVEIDFSRVRHISDFALGILATGLGGAEQVRLLGLPSHAQRVLRAFGLAA